MENLSDHSYLGFDFSTQQLKAIVINENHETIHEASVTFDSDLPEFRTQGGVNKGPDQVVTAPTLMWVKALDMVLEKLKISGLDFDSVAALSGSGQQHGSVFWKKGARELLNNLKPDKFLHDQLQSAFTFRVSPVWMDSSTSKQCTQLETAVGSAFELANITGSRAYKRFTGNQIAKVYQTRSDSYHNTERISLVSNFAASLFLGDFAPIDISDGSGMNLLDVRLRKWSQVCLEACGPDLAEKLGEDVVPSHTRLGPIANYFVERYGFNPKCSVIAFMGDNPASLVGMGLKEGDVAVSLGTSDTLFMWLKDFKPSLHGHVLCNPIKPDSYMALIYFKNGSRTRERIKEECGEGDWNLFNELLGLFRISGEFRSNMHNLDSTPRGNFANIGFYLDMNEIYPVISGDYRYNKFNERVSNFSKEVDVRACIESQFLRLRSHAENFCSDSGGPYSRILACGGASVNEAILQVLSDIFNAPVYVPHRPNSAALGAALMAKYALKKDSFNFHEMIGAFETFKLATTPAKDSNSIYSRMLLRFKELEAKLSLLTKNE